MIRGMATLAGEPIFGAETSAVSAALRFLRQPAAGVPVRELRVRPVTPLPPAQPKRA